MELQHFSHNHPLIFNNDLQTNNHSIDETCCSACGENLSSTSPAGHYGCVECKYFLHKTRAELPNEINHFLHPQHPLTLIAEFNSYNYCNACTDLSDGFFYDCVKCNFCIHSTCSSLPRVRKFECHQHPITLHINPAEESSIRICQICNIKTTPSCVPYYCTDCNFAAHFLCVHDVENSSCEESKIDLESKLACHLSFCNLQPADMEDESGLLSWQNSCAEEYQHISMEQLKLLEF